jgi:catechol 2,3-dioxygenase-like lactoylglutathione lyase family enzyme
MANEPAPVLPANPRWRGVHHLALITSDMDATVRFYAGVLGARLVATIGTPAFRHYFFEFGPGSTVAFFEYRDVEVEQYAKPAGVPHPRVSQFDHLSLGVGDEAALLELRERLKQANCEVTDVVDHGIMHSIYFTDPNGIALEASHWLVDPTGHAELSLEDGTIFDDANPVPAVTELREAGRFTTLAATRLIGGYTTRTEDWVAGRDR